ncbi:hypothetical protein VTN00DRAFT_1551 [Thermoascus crustaceus]|uniref:uncharacterized protein n=1 Tax=Thermoascus crustaceus TaxID=5088 RepID=UPI0037423BED
MTSQPGLAGFPTGRDAHRIHGLLARVSGMGDVHTACLHRLEGLCSGTLSPKGLADGRLNRACLGADLLEDTWKHRSGLSKLPRVRRNPIAQNPASHIDLADGDEMPLCLLAQAPCKGLTRGLGCGGMRPVTVADGSVDIHAARRLVAWRWPARRLQLPGQIRYRYRAASPPSLPVTSPLLLPTIPPSRHPASSLQDLRISLLALCSASHRSPPGAALCPSVYAGSPLPSFHPDQGIGLVFEQGPAVTTPVRPAIDEPTSKTDLQTFLAP